MRSAGSDTQLVFSDNNHLIGAFLAADFCAEHEVGIDHLLLLFGVTKTPGQFGVESRRIADPSSLVFRVNGKSTEALLYAGYSLQQETQKITLGKLAQKLGCYISDKDKISAAWGRDGFAIYAPTAELSHHLKEIHQAFLRKDALIMLGGGLDNPFARAGLAIGIISQMPEEVKTSLYAADEDAFKLKQAATATGIYDLIERHYYFALSPAWCEPSFERLHSRSEDGESKRETAKTKYPVKFWLNPTHQDKNAAGWFTVEELTAWIKGEAPNGPIANRGTVWQQKQRAKQIARGNVDYLYSDEAFCKPCMNIINIGRSHYGYSRRCPCGNTDLITRAKAGVR